MEEKAVETEQAKMYTQEEVNEIIRKMIRQERELLCQVIRGMPNLDAATRQRWIENPTAVSTVLSQGFPSSHFVDLDADPFVSNGWEVVEHIKGGQFEWDPTKVAFYLSADQRSGKINQGHKLREELKGEPVFNANLLGYLFAHQELIPDKWKGKSVFFWGTIYRGSDDDLGVRYLYWRVGGWHWAYHWLDVGFSSDYLAALRAK